MIGGFVAFALGCSVGALANIDVASWLFQSNRIWWVGGPVGRRRERRLELCGRHQPHLASPPPRLEAARVAGRQMIADALDAFAEIFSPPFRRVMWKSLGLTAGVLVLAGVGLDRLALSLVHAGPAWLSAILSVVVALGLFVGVIFLVAADGVAGRELLSRRHCGDRRASRSIRMGRRADRSPLVASVAMGMRFAILSILVNLIVLALTLFTGVGLASFFVLNGYLLGREYFELAAMRHVSAAEARSSFPSALADNLYRRRHRLRFRRRAGSEPAHAPLRDRVHGAGVQTGPLD